MAGLEEFLFEGSLPSMDFLPDEPLSAYGTSLDRFLEDMEVASSDLHSVHVNQDVQLGQQNRALLEARLHCTHTHQQGPDVCGMQPRVRLPACHLWPQWDAKSTPFAPPKWQQQQHQSSRGTQSVGLPVFSPRDELPTRPDLRRLACDGRPPMQQPQWRREVPAAPALAPEQAWAPPPPPPRIFAAEHSVQSAAQTHVQFRQHSVASVQLSPHQAQPPYSTKTQHPPRHSDMHPIQTRSMPVQVMHTSRSGNLCSGSRTESVRTLQDCDAHAGAAASSQAAQQMPQPTHKQPASSRAAAACAGAPSKSSSAQTKSAQRRHNNRQAQQRYREKRKAQAATLEQRVAELTHELQRLRATKAEASKLAAENARLRAALPDAAVEDVAELQEPEPPGCEGKAMSAVQNTPADPYLGSMSPRQYCVEKYQDVVKELADAKQRMAALLRVNEASLDCVRPGFALSDAVELKLVGLLEPAIQSSFQQAMLAPVCEHDVLQHLGLPPRNDVCNHFPGRWQAILRNCALDAMQQDTLLAARTQVLQRLHAVYVERQQLYQVAMRTMQPQQGWDDKGHSGMSPRKSASTTNAVAKSRCMAWWCSCCILSQSAALLQSLDGLTSNLGTERKLMFQMHDLLLRRVLTPLQTTLMLLQADADPIEPLHIANLVALDRGVPLTPQLPRLNGCHRDSSMAPHTYGGRVAVGRGGGGGVGQADAMRECGPSLHTTAIGAPGPRMMGAMIAPPCSDGRGFAPPRAAAQELYVAQHV